LLVNSSGGKYFRYNYRFDGKRKTLAFGTYPATSLKDAREKRDTAIKQISGGIDPSETRKEIKAIKQLATENKSRLDAGLPIINSFEHVARDWLSSISHIVRDITHQKKIRCFELYVFPTIGGLAIGEIKSPDFYSLIKSIISNNKLETAH
jgi:hypothetical protein